MFYSFVCFDNIVVSIYPFIFATGNYTILYCFAKIDIFLKPNGQLSNYKIYHFREVTK